MFLLFDISTNGQPKNWKAHFTDTFSWPKLIHISWLQYDKKGELTEEGDYIINPVGLEIAPEALRKAGLTEEEIREKGVEVKEALEKFDQALAKAIYVFAFNLQYSENVVLAEFYRANMMHKMGQTERYCLMRESTYYCKIKGRGAGYKWPSLTQLHTKVFGASYEGAGHAQKDIMAVSRCFNKLLSMGELDDLF